MNNQNNQDQGASSNQSLDYETWVNSLGNIQDGVFQNTPMSNHIINNFGYQQQQQPSQPIPLIGVPLNPEFNNDLFFNSPERFYREIINESPVMNRTPQFGRTPLKSLNINFSTPNFLKTMETGSSASKNFTPLKNQIYQNSPLFRTPDDKKQDSTLNSSPTTIKMNSSAIKNDENSVQDNQKVLPPSPTPASKKTQYQKLHQDANIQQHLQNDQAQHQRQNLPDIPKMGFFKKQDDSAQKVSHTLVPTQQQTRRVNHPNNTKFQIIISDVNTFANSAKPKAKKKKLARSSTSVNTSTSATKNSSKKSTLKRSVSQPQSRIGKTTPGNTSKDIDSEKFLNTSTNLVNISSGSIGNSHSEISVDDLFDEKVLPDDSINQW